MAAIVRGRARVCVGDTVESLTVYGVDLTSGTETEMGKAKLAPSHGGMQIEVHSVGPSVQKHIRIVIESGYDDFCSIHRVEFE